MEVVKHPIQDRVFTFCGFEPYQRKDGEWTELKLWQTLCRVCSKPFVVKTPSSTKRFIDSNSFGMVHCEEHRRK